MPSLLEALEQKYGESSAESDGSEEDEGISVAIFLPKKPPRKTVPSLLVLNDCDIACAGDKEALINKCAAVEELDLAKNKLEHWPEVFGILLQMPKLKFVNLSFNQLSSPLHEVQLSEDLQWRNLRNLVLNSTQVPWINVSYILDHLPNLEELHLSLNEYDHVNLCSEYCERCCCCCGDSKKWTQDHREEQAINSPITMTTKTDDDEDEEIPPRCTCDYKNRRHKHAGIKKVYFTGNPVDKWSEICKIGYAFPNLECLVVADCPIESLSPMSNAESTTNGEYVRSESTSEADIEKIESPHDGFRKLKLLNLNSTNISTWDDIEKLSKFPLLQSLRVQGCKLWDSLEYTEHERRQFLIARLPNVVTLNGGGNIGSDEREDAERAFIRHFMDKPESDRPERYFDLVAVHGKLDPLVNVDLRPEKRVKITFTCGNNSDVRSVDVYRTVSDLKSKLEDFAGFSAAKMRLFYVDQDFQEPEEMRYPHKRLLSYNICSGDEIIIDYKLRCSKSKS